MLWTQATRVLLAVGQPKELARLAGTYCWCVLGSLIDSNGGLGSGIRAGAKGVAEPPRDASGTMHRWLVRFKRRLRHDVAALQRRVAAAGRIHHGVVPQVLHPRALGVRVHAAAAALARGARSDAAVLLDRPLHARDPARRRRRAAARCSEVESSIRRRRVPCPPCQCAALSRCAAASCVSHERSIPPHPRPLPPRLACDVRASAPAQSARQWSRPRPHGASRTPRRAS